MSGSLQEAKTRQLAVSRGPEAKKECGRCPFAKEYGLIEKQFALVDRRGRMHVLSGYVREGGNWLDGMVSILKQNGAAAERVYLPGCGWGISPVVLKDGTVIENPHGYFDRNLPVAAVNGEKTELNFANIRIQDQEVVVKDEEPKCPFGNALVDTEGIVFGKGEYGELDPGSGTISWGRVNPAGGALRPLVGMAPACLLPGAEMPLNYLPAPLQSLVIGARGYDAVAFRKMDAREEVFAYVHEFAAPQAAAYLSPTQEIPAHASEVHADTARAIAAAPVAPAYVLSAHRIKIGDMERWPERTEAVENMARPERREEAKCWEKAAIADAGRAPMAEAPSQVEKLRFSCGEGAAWKHEFPKEKRKMEKGGGETGKKIGRKDRPQKDVYAKGAGVEHPVLVKDAAAAPRSGKGAIFINWKFEIPEIPRLVKRGKERAKEGPAGETAKENNAPKAARRARKGVRRAIPEKAEQKDAGARHLGRERKVHSALKMGGPAVKAKRSRRREKAAELRPKKAREKKARGREVARTAGKRKKRCGYAERCLLMEKGRKRKRRNWLSVSKR